jgi:hypothetical protein
MELIEEAHGRVVLAATHEPRLVVDFSGIDLVSSAGSSDAAACFHWPVAALFL